MEISLRSLEIMLPCLLDIWCFTLRLVCVLRKLIKITADQFWSYGSDNVYMISAYQFKGLCMHARTCVRVCTCSRYIHVKKL
jgi:hypothetical protein